MDLLRSNQPLSIRFSSEIDKIANKLVDAQLEMDSVSKDKNNPFFKSKYADLASIVATVKPVLNKHDIAILNPYCRLDGMPAVGVFLVHRTGQWIEAVGASEPKEKGPQADGSVSTYTRRYGTQHMLCLEVEDDDGEAAHGRVGGKPIQQTTVSRPVAVPPPQPQYTPPANPSQGLKVEALKPFCVRGETSTDKMLELAKTKALKGMEFYSLSEATLGRRVGSLSQIFLDEVPKLTEAILRLPNVTV